MIKLAGLPFMIEPQAQLSTEEHTALGRWADLATVPGSSPHPEFRLSLVTEPPFTEDDSSAPAIGEPARVSWHGERVRISHALLSAELDPVAACGRLYRRSASAFSLEVTLRVALCCRLPLAGGLPLHAAGIVIDGQGLAFFGASGAGKSTLAASSPYPVLSDELVAAKVSPPRLVSTGFWGELNRRCEHQNVPLRGLIALACGSATLLENLEPATGTRLLLGVLLVPGVPPLWREAIGIAAALAHSLPIYRMAWSPARPPWPEIRSTLGL